MLFLSKLSDSSEETMTANQAGVPECDKHCADLRLQPANDRVDV